MHESITYAQLNVALQQLGFQKTDSAGGPVGYRHIPSETVLLFKPHRPSDAVPPGSLAATRKLLVERGLIDAAGLEEMLHSVAA